VSRDLYVPLGVRGDATANIHLWKRPRAYANREMVSGLVSDALYKEIKARAAARDMRIYKLLDEMNLGASSYSRMRAAQPIAQATALKVVTFFGTSVRAVLTKYHQEKIK
jgi:hypothetical protein